MELFILMNIDKISLHFFKNFIEKLLVKLKLLVTEKSFIDNDHNLNNSYTQYHRISFFYILNLYFECINFKKYFFICVYQKFKFNLFSSVFIYKKFDMLEKFVRNYCNIMEWGIILMINYVKSLVIKEK